MNRTATNVPAELRERFLPQEDPAFEVIQERGHLRLWKSVSKEFLVQGHLRRSTTRFHITEHEQLDICHMPDLEHAVPNFEWMCQRAGV